MCGSKHHHQPSILKFRHRTCQHNINSIVASLTPTAIMLSYLRGLAQGNMAPRILITAKTSSDEMSWSGAGPAFSVIFEVVVEADIPITILPDRTLLESGNGTFGLTFTNVETGETFTRPALYVYVRPSFNIADEAAEIPQEGSSSVLTVTHVFIPPRQRSDWLGDSSGLKVGQTYSIGLGEARSKVRWWEWGRKNEVFSFPFSYLRRSRLPREGTPELQMVLVNQVEFRVVE